MPDDSSARATEEDVVRSAARDLAQVQDLRRLNAADRVGGDTGLFEEGGRVVMEGLGAAAERGLHRLDLGSGSHLLAAVVVGAHAEPHEGGRAREGKHGDHTCQKRSDLIPHVKSEPRGCWVWRTSYGPP